MNYIYDILVNFNSDDIFEFYEWKQNDNIEHLRKVPIFKIKTNDFLNFRNNKVIVDKMFLNKIKNKTEIFTNTSVGIIEFSALITDGMDLVIIEFNSDGESILKSSMLLDEYEDTLDESELLDITNIKYEILEEKRKPDFMTRFQREVINYIENELENLISKKSFNKLKYLYYEWYNTKNNDMTNMIGKLLNIINEDFSDKHVKFFDLLKLSNMKKQL